jgi:hypothetical protein
LLVTKELLALLLKRLTDFGGNLTTHDVKDFCERGVVCRRAKIQPHMPAALYPLHVPPIPWHTFGLDYLTHLHVSNNGLDSVMIVIDHLTRMAHFLPCTKSVTIEETTNLVL